MLRRFCFVAPFVVTVVGLVGGFVVAVGFVGAFVLRTGFVVDVVSAHK